MTDLQKKDLIIEALTAENTELKTRIAKLEKGLPIPTVWAKVYFWLNMFEPKKSYPHQKKAS